MHRKHGNPEHRIPHLYVRDPDVPPDWKGDRPCGHPGCGLPQVNELHVTPRELYEPTSEDVVAVEQRRVGEAGR